ncbi:oogenesin-3-like isoform X2 [Rattus norvegicus]|uniref:oogenesin-3-like isoform X2 n=1 Tax=Rattus norvegicus TaxID=10116 RepID=UPI00026885C6|nr:oogenesin-3-like isoform X2 [Rattus norvegicus]|eukprot:XP_003751381.1 PREDICTED: PRAME family member 8-like isoform X2 [Rattus norvegicus]
MSVQSPPTFQKLARQTLLRNEAVIISFLEELPTVLFPALFKEAFEGRHSKLMKEQVTTWPFPCLPVGALMKTPNLETLHAVLEGVDMLLTRDIHHRSLMTPLVKLSIKHYRISQKDLDSFSCCQSLFHLKHLEMSGVTLSSLDIMPLRSLVEKVADKIQTLDLQGCRMKDYQLNALLPALTQCCQVAKINFYNNDFSMHILKDFLKHTATWSKINVEQYPAPLECYDELAHVCRERFAQLCLELIDTLGTIRQLKIISFATNMCHKCGMQCVYG